MKKKALLVTRVSGFVPQFETDAVHILQDMGYEVHYAANFDQIVYGKDADFYYPYGNVRLNAAKSAWQRLEEL